MVCRQEEPAGDCNNKGGNVKKTMDSTTLTTIKLLEEFRLKKRFATRGTSFAKRMWRNGYNKAIDEIIVWVEQQEEKKIVRH